MMKIRYYSAASPVAVGLVWMMTAEETAPWPVVAGGGLLVLLSSTWPGLASSRYKGRLNPLAALVRGSAHMGYRLRTHKDPTPNGDLDRGPSYCLEWCLIAGLVVAGVATQIPPLSPWAWWFGAAVALGCAAHVLADWPTPTGVPLSAVYNWVAHGQVWCRHSLGWSDTDSGGDMFLVVPALFVLTGVMALAMVGALSPVLVLLTGWV